MIFFSLNAAGGSASAFLSLANALQEAGNKVDVYTYYWNKKDCFPELTKGLNIKCVKEINSKDTILNNNSLLARLLLGVDYYINAKKLYKLFKRFDYDVIYASEALAYIPALLYKEIYNVPVVWSVFDPISLVDREKPGLLINKYKWFEYLLKIHNFFDSKNINKINAILVPTHKMKKQLDSFYNINSTVFPLAGIRIDEFKKDRRDLIEKRLRSKFDFVKNNELILLSIGHFLPHRRYEDSLFALEKIIKNRHEVKFIISGSDKFDPQYYNFIVNLVRKLDLEKNVILDTDFKSNNEIIGYYQYSDIFLFVSVEQTWGLSPFEAMAAKKPVIISRGVGGHEVLKDNIHALIVDDKSPSQIANKINQLITDKKLYTFISQEGYKLAISHFSYSVIAGKLVQFINQLIKQGSGITLHY